MYHFAHVFQQAHGLTPMNYLRRARLERALGLLAEREMSVNEVAEKVGLSRLALWRGVRKLRGVSPREVAIETQRRGMPDRRQMRE